MFKNPKNKNFLRKLESVGFSGKIKINHSKSHSFSGLQITDFFAWACFKKIEFGNNDFIDLIRNKTELIQLW